MTNQLNQDPRNPYESYLIDASAGCGKTYQLTQRFLCLVAAGASPDRILTITFTTKAAAEMRERVLHSAHALISDPKAQENLNGVMSGFHRTFGKATDRQPPIAPATVGQIILDHAQRLKIGTIDSVFHDWVRRFTHEASSDATPLPPLFNLMSNAQISAINAQAWRNTVKSDLDGWQQQHPQAYEELIANHGILGLEKFLQETHQHETYIWSARQQTGNFFIPHPISTPHRSKQATLDALKVEMRKIKESSLATAGLKSRLEACLASNNIEMILEQGILTKKDWSANKRYLKKEEKHAALQTEISSIEKTFQDYMEQKLLRKFNAQGSALADLQHSWQIQKQRLKSQQNFLSFSDLATGSYQLFHGDRGMGVKFLIQQQIEHMLIDEFQDTSLLQWSVFSVLAEELLAGQGVQEDDGRARPSVFLVGDVKQSIYGFREADPRVMDSAHQQLGELGLKTIRLSHSFRSSSVVLDAVNDMFASKFDDYPVHQTASLDGQLMVPRHGEFLIFPEIAKPSDRTEPSAKDREASLIGDRLKAVFDKPESYPVFDRSSRSWRPIEPRDCAILYRNATQSKLLLAALHDRGIPALREEAKGLFEHPLVQDIMALWRYLAVPQDLSALLHVLRSPFFRLSDAQLGLLVERSSERRDADSVNQALEGLYPALWQQLHDVRRRSWTERPSHVLRHLCRSTHLFHNFERELSPVEIEKHRAIISTLLQILVDAEQHGSLLPHDVHDHLLTLRDSDDLGLPPMASNAVRLMTIHKSKGLEFPLVILADCANRWHKDDRYWLRTEGLDTQGLQFVGTGEESPKNSHYFDEKKRASRHEMMQETLRVLYVAITRSIHYVWVTGHTVHQPPQPDHNVLKLMRDEAERKQWSLVTKDDYEVFEKKFIHESSLQLKPRETSKFEPTGTPVGTFVENLLSANNTLAWPSQLNSVAPHAAGLSPSVPSKPSDSSYHPRLAAAVGTYIHSGMEHLVKSQDWNREQSWTLALATTEHAHEPDLQPVLDAQRAMADNELNSALTHPPFQALMQQGELLKSEANFVWKQSDAMWRGSMDLVIISPSSRQVHVIDYKTGITDEHRAKSDYQAQLTVYKEALEQMYPGWDVKSSLFLTAIPKLIEL